MSVVVTLGDGFKVESTGDVRLQFGDGDLAVYANGTTVRLDSIPSDILICGCESSRPKRRRLVPVATDDDDDDDDAQSEPDSFKIRVGDVVLVNLSSENGLFLVTDVADDAGPGSLLKGFWFYRKEELKSAEGVVEPYVFSTLDDGGNLLYDSVIETCRPLDWYYDKGRDNPRVAPFMYSVSRQRFLMDVPRWLVLGWAAAASKQKEEVREAILNQVGPLLGARYGQIMDDLALCGPAGTNTSALIKQEIIMKRAVVTQGSTRTAKSGTCWACGASKPLSGAVGSHKVGRACAAKLSCLSNLVGIFEEFLSQPFDPDTAGDTIRAANDAITPA